MEECSVCSKECKELQCFYCKNWYYGKCCAISEDNVKSWSQHSMKFACRSCAFDGEEYDAHAALVRLRAEKLSCCRNALYNQARSEMLLLKSYGIEIPVKEHLFHNTRDIDTVSQKILGMFEPKKLDETVPLSTVGDRNCMYRAVSLCICGTESFHVLMRLITTLELILNRTSYDTKKKFNNFLNDNRIVTSQFEQLVTGAMQESEYAEMAHIYALSAALGQPICSCFPSQSNKELSSAFNRIVCGRNVFPRAPRVTLMWTSMVTPSTSISFTPNHFVPLVYKSCCVDLGTINLSSISSCTFGSLDLSGSVPELTNIEPESVMNVSSTDSSFPSFESDAGVDFTNSSQFQDSHVQTEPVSDTIRSSNVDNESDYHNFPVYDSYSDLGDACRNKIHEIQIESEIVPDNSNTQSNPISGGPHSNDNTIGSLPSGFMDISEVVRILTGAQTGKQHIPSGLKKMYFSL